MTKSPFCDGLYTFGVMASRYPIILAHGIVIKDYKFFRAFGRIEKTLKNAGYDVYTSHTDGFGSIENNAAQLCDLTGGLHIHIIRVPDSAAYERIKNKLLKLGILESDNRLAK